MAIYEHKDFLTFDDVADYLKDKGVCDFDLSQEHNRIKLEKTLIEWARFEKITPVFYNTSTVDVVSYQYDEKYRARIKLIDGGIMLDGYYSIDCSAFEFILKNGMIKTDYQDESNIEYDVLNYHVYQDESNMGMGGYC